MLTGWEVNPQEFADAEAHPLRESIRKLLTQKQRRREWTIEELSNHFDAGIGKIKEAVSQLADKRLNLRTTAEGGLWVASDLPVREPTTIDLRTLKGNAISFGLTADNHLGSRYARNDVLNALFDLWADMGITTVYQGGNMIEGEATFNKGDLVAHGIEGQLDYFIENWPQRKGITTRFVTGDDHEGWYVQRESIDIGQLIEDRARKAGRTDLVYLGHMEHDFILKAEHGNATMRLIHAGGGSAYAYSYSVQKLVESYTGGEKPNILLVGHFHKFEYSYPRGVHCVQAGCTQDQTPFLRKKRIEAMIGGCTISFTQSKDGLVHGFTPRFDPFYDRDFYADSTWRYIWKGK